MHRPNADSPAPAAPDRDFQFLSGPACPVLLGLVCFLNSLGNGFVYDDTEIVRDNPRIRSLANVREIWLTDWWRPVKPRLANEPIAPLPVDLPEPPQRRDRLYRPFTLYTFAMNYAAGGLQPLGYHAVNVALHALACFLVWHFAWRIFADRSIAAVTAALFAVHPVHSEAVANIVGRAEVLAAVLLLGGLLALLPRRDSPSLPRVVLAAVLFLGALFSKETAVCYLPVAALAVHARLAREHVRRPAGWWLSRGAILVLPLFVYLPLRYVALEHHLLRDQAPSVLFNPLVIAGPLERIVAAFTIVGQYVRLFLVPMKLSCDYGLAIIDPDSGANAWTLVGLAAAAGAAVALLGYRRVREWWRQLAVAAALTAASYALISNTVLRIGVTLAERLMYWPSVPILLVIGVGVVALWRAHARPGGAVHNLAPLLRIAGVLLLVALGLRTVVRNADWHDDYRLFTTDVQTYPRGIHLNLSVARELIWIGAAEPAGSPQRRDVLAAADQRLQRAWELYPRHAETLQLRGRVRGLMGDVDGAMQYFDAALRLNPADDASRALLAGLHGDPAEQAARIAELQSQVQQAPEDVRLRVALGDALLDAGQQVDALVQFEYAARLAPHDPEVLRALGETLALLGDGERATQVLEQVVELEPNDWRTHVNLTALLGTKAPERALAHARAAYRLEPGALATNQNLAEALALNGQVNESLEILRRIESSLPEDDPVRASIHDRILELEAGHL